MLLHPKTIIENHFRKKSQQWFFFCLSLKNVRHSCSVCSYFKSKIQVRLSFYTSRPSARQWSLISLCSHQDPLRSNGHWFTYVHDPLQRNGHWFPYAYIKTLYKAMVMVFSSSRPSARQWSSISLHQDPLQGNGHWFPMSHQDHLQSNDHGFSQHRGPLRGNGHRSPYIKTLCKAMVIDFLCHIEALYEAMVINLFTSRPSVRQWSLISFVRSWPSTW